MIEHAFANIARSNRASLRLSNSKNPVCPCLTAEIRKLRVAVLGEEEPRGPQRSTVEIMDSRLDRTAPRSRARRSNSHRQPPAPFR